MNVCAKLEDNKAILGFCILKEIRSLISFQRPTNPHPWIGGIFVSSSNSLSYMFCSPSPNRETEPLSAKKFVIIDRSQGSLKSWTSSIIMLLYFCIFSRYGLKNDSSSKSWIFILRWLHWLASLMKNWCQFITSNMFGEKSAGTCWLGILMY